MKFWRTRPSLGRAIVTLSSAWSPNASKEFAVASSLVHDGQIACMGRAGQILHDQLPTVSRSLIDALFSARGSCGSSRSPRSHAALISFSQGPKALRRRIHRGADPHGWTHGDAGSILAREAFMCLGQGRVGPDRGGIPLHDLLDGHLVSAVDAIEANPPRTTGWSFSTTTTAA